ncbi:MAG: hypothetical protein JWL75_482 [Parcubacteria group bacterium]|nr:hypothetical protein [Parcubacteria group bacterium]
MVPFSRTDYLDRAAAFAARAKQLRIEGNHVHADSHEATAAKYAAVAARMGPREVVSNAPVAMIRNAVSEQVAMVG